MAALALGGRDPLGGPRKRLPLTLGRLVGVGGIALAVAIAWNLYTAQVVTERPNEMKTTTVMLPPPPPPPPPPKEQEVAPPEPTVAPPLDQPVEAPTPPTPDAPSSDPAPGDNALTAREGAGPSNYGLAAGDGSGTRIGGRPGGSGGNAFAAYGQIAVSDIRRAAQADRELNRGRYRIEEIEIAVGADGRITRVRVLRGGDERRNARLSTLLLGLQLSQRPPAGMPSMRVSMSGS